MRKLCPNLDREDALDTVLEVPVPDEAPYDGKAGRSGTRSGRLRCRTVKAWMRSHIDPRRAPLLSRRGGRGAGADQLQLMLGVIGAPLVPQPVEARRAMACRDIKDEPLEASMAQYIVEQYIAAAGGEAALSAATSMYAMGKVRMTASDNRHGKKKAGGGRRGEEVGGFVVWQKRPELWCVELVVSGCKVSAGSDGKVAWRQTPWQQAHASRGPPRPLRRCIQGLDPKSTADLFANAVWVGEKAIAGDDCFALRVDASPGALRARSSGGVEVVRHAVWGYFSQKTGLLVHLEDSHLLRLQGQSKKESVYWETSIESSIGDYRPVDGINIAHSGRTVVSLFRFGGQAGGECGDCVRSCSRMEETWSIEEVDFNIMGLSMDCFLPPRDLAEEEEDKKVDATAGHDVGVKGIGARPPVSKVQISATGWFGPAKVVAVDTDESDLADEADHKQNL